MAGGYVTGLAAALEQHRSLAGFQRLHDDVRGVPTISAASSRKRKKQGVSVREHLRRSGQFVRFDRRDDFWLTAAGRHAHDPFAALAEEDRVRPPDDAKWLVG